MLIRSLVSTVGVVEGFEPEFGGCIAALFVLYYIIITTVICITSIFISFTIPPLSALSAHPSPYPLLDHVAISIMCGLVITIITISFAISHNSFLKWLVPFRNIQFEEEIAAKPAPATTAPKNDRYRPNGLFTERARKVLILAREEAQRLQHNYIGTEHLLLGLVLEGGGVATKVLSNLGVELNQVRISVEFLIKHGDHNVQGEIGLTPRAKKMIEFAVDEANRLNHHYIGTEHLLLGMLREGEGIAGGVLAAYGVTLAEARTQTTLYLKQFSETNY